MKYYAMWHPEYKWGPTSAPVLLRHKRLAVAGTGLTLRRMREMGWRWVEVDVPEPGGEPEAETLEEFVLKVAMQLSVNVDPAMRDLSTDLMEALEGRQ